MMTQLKKTESTNTRTVGGLDFTAICGKRQGREVPQSLQVTRWNRGFVYSYNPVRSPAVAGFATPNQPKTIRIGIPFERHR
jgi:hypothetical protein